MRASLLVLLVVLVCVSAMPAVRRHVRAQRHAAAQQALAEEERALTTTSVGSNWYDGAAATEYCGVTTQVLDGLAFATWETQWAIAYGAKTTTGCGGKTARQVFDMVKAAQVKAVQATPDLTGFSDLATACKADLTGTTTGYALWSGGFACSEVAQQAGLTTLEATKFGKVLNAVFTYPEGAKAALLAPEWKKCCGKMWNAVSVMFVDQMTGVVTVYFRFAGTDSVLYKQELPAIQVLFPAKVTTVKFEVVQQTSCGTWADCSTSFTTGTLTTHLVSTATACNVKHVGAVKMAF